MLFCGTHLYRWMDGKFQPADDLSLPISGEPDERRYQAKRLPFNYDPLRRLNSFVNGEFRSWALSDLPPVVNNPYPVQDQQGNIWFGSDERLVKTENGRVAKAYTMNNGLPSKYRKLVCGQMPLKVLSLRDDRSLWLTELDSMQSYLVVQRLPGRLA